MKIYGNNLGWSDNKNFNNKQSRTAREQYRKSVDTSKAEELNTSKVPYQPIYSSAYDGGELFGNFLGLVSPTRWAGAIGRASRGEGNTGTFVGRVLNNMLDPQNGARENQGIFSIGLSPTDEQWAAEHPTTSGLINGVLDFAAYGPKPRLRPKVKTKTTYGYPGRKFGKRPLVEVPLYEGELGLSPGVSIGKNATFEEGRQIGTTMIPGKKPMINPGTKVTHLKETPIGEHLVLDGGMSSMYPAVMFTTANKAGLIR